MIEAAASKIQTHWFRKQGTYISSEIQPHLPDSESNLNYQAPVSSSASTSRPASLSSSPPKRVPYLCGTQPRASGAGLSRSPASSASSTSYITWSTSGGPARSPHGLASRLDASAPAWVPAAYHATQVPPAHVLLYVHADFAGGSCRGVQWARRLLWHYE